MNQELPSTFTTGRKGERAKRILDVLFSGTLLIVLSPLLALLALLVRSSSPGPVFFRQERVGRYGQSFRLYKFRSMRMTSGGISVTTGQDSRVTPLGRRMRQWKLDEFPQLLNVLKGEMSLVGPRPEVPQYVAYYTAEQRRVLSVRPGVTGVCQLAFRHEETLLAGREDVEGFYLNTVMPYKLRLDLRYVEERSLWGDLVLLYRTLSAIARRQPEATAEDWPF